MTHVEQYKRERTEERGPLYKCCVGCDDMYDENNLPNCRLKKVQALNKMTRAMNSEQLPIDVMNRKVIKVSLCYRELVVFEAGMKDVDRIREEKNIPALDYQQYETVKYNPLRPVYTADTPNII